jgi:hypothetical protein
MRPFGEKDLSSHLDQGKIYHPGLRITNLLGKSQPRELATSADKGLLHTMNFLAIF